MLLSDWIAETVDPNYEPQVTVKGVGRIGSYESAVRRHRSRARQFWQVCYSDGTRTETGYATIVVGELGPYKTGQEAAVAAETFAALKGWALSNYAKSLLPRKR